MIAVSKAWHRTTAWVLGASATLFLMHTADELWSRWDFGAQLSSSTLAVLVMGGTVGAAFLALAGVLAANRWGLGLAALLGAFAAYSGGTHFFNTDGMDAARWLVVVPQVAMGLVLLVMAGREVLVTGVARRPRAAGL